MSTSRTISIFPSASNGAAPAVTADAHFAAVEALLHFEGADGSTTFTDETGRTWATPDSAVLDDAHPAFGATSLHNGTIIATPGVTMTGDFTIEGWIYMTANSGARGFFRIGNEAAGRSSFDVVGGKLSYNIYGTASVTFTTVNVPLNALTHIAFERHQGVIRGYVNGRLAGSSTNITTLGNTGEMAVGSGAEHWLDEVRFTNGLARYKGEFVVPSATFEPAASDSGGGGGGGGVTDHTVSASSIVVPDGANGPLQESSTATVNDGVGPFTYAWTWEGLHTGLTFVGSTTGSSVIVESTGTNQENIGTLRCTVTDTGNGSHVAFDDAVVSFVHGTPP